MSEDTDKKIQKLQLMEQNIQQLVAQKQQFQSQLIEIESALSEIDKTDTAYKIIGNIMVAAPKDEIKKGLNSKKDAAEMRIKAFDRQEEDIKSRAKKIQEEILKTMEGKK